MKNRGEVRNLKNIKQDDKKSSPNNNDEPQKPSSNIGGESQNSSLKQPVDKNVPTTRSTCNDLIPPQYSTNQNELLSEMMHHDPPPSQKKNDEDQLLSSNNDDERDPSLYKSGKNLVTPDKKQAENRKPPNERYAEVRTFEETDGVTLLAKMNYNVSISFRLTASRTRSTEFVLDTST